MRRAPGAEEVDTAASINLGSTSTTTSGSTTMTRRWSRSATTISGAASTTPTPSGSSTFTGGMWDEVTKGCVSFASKRMREFRVGKKYSLVWVIAC